MNLAIITGNVGKDPEIRATTSGQKVASFSIATSEKWTSKSGEKKESTEWHNIVAWEKLADLVAKYVVKGSKITITGKIQTRSWDNKDGARMYKTEIIARDLEFVGSKPSGSDQHSEPEASNSGEPEPVSEDLPF